MILWGSLLESWYRFLSLTGDEVSAEVERISFSDLFTTARALQRKGLDVCLTVGGHVYSQHIYKRGVLNTDLCERGSSITPSNFASQKAQLLVRSRFFRIRCAFTGLWSEVFTSVIELYNMKSASTGQVDFTLYRIRSVHEGVLSCKEYTDTTKNIFFDSSKSRSCKNEWTKYSLSLSKRPRRPAYTVSRNDNPHKLRVVCTRPIERMGCDGLISLQVKSYWNISFGKKCLRKPWYIQNLEWRGNGSQADLWVVISSYFKFVRRRKQERAFWESCKNFTSLYSSVKLVSGPQNLHHNSHIFRFTQIWTSNLFILKIRWIPESWETFLERGVLSKLNRRKGMRIWISICKIIFMRALGRRVGETRPLQGCGLWGIRRSSEAFQLGNLDRRAIWQHPIPPRSSAHALPYPEAPHSFEAIVST